MDNENIYNYSDIVEPLLETQLLEFYEAEGLPKVLKTIHSSFPDLTEESLVTYLSGWLLDNLEDLTITPSEMETFLEKIGAE